ncbi:MAG: hypothetical protein C0520_15395 [Sphingopyxis sp.]|jgi:hypothetical protein|nr:hypothetical protein [Sphingopyxis sp.]
MKRLLILFLALFAFAAPVQVLAAQTMCANTMPMMASMDHGMKKGGCCDEKNKACMQACDATCAVAIVLPPQMPVRATLEPASLPVTTLASLTIARIASGLDRPPRTIV